MQLTALLYLNDIKCLCVCFFFLKEKRIKEPILANQKRESDINPFKESYHRTHCVENYYESHHYSPSDLLYDLHNCAEWLIVCGLRFTWIA